MAMVNFFESILDLFYPRFCYSCQEKINAAGPIYLCSRCTSRVLLAGDKVCPVCGRPGHIEICPYCRDERPPYKMARSAGLYEGVLKEGIHRLKYNGNRHLAPAFARFLIRAFEKETEWGGNIDLVVPVPMEKKRKRERGFNQSELLAKYFCKGLPIPFNSRILLKIKKTLAQVNLTREKRSVNLLGAFYLNPRISIPGKRVLLIDDVYTTGATASECANTLLRGGAKEVSILTLARGV